ncbi:MAG: hypothetical protein JO364_16315 [Pseudonocardiales bacterium]|nr:hypothetical protein [Pseudonocardiales bacterium]
MDKKADYPPGNHKVAPGRGRKTVAMPASPSEPGSSVSSVMTAIIRRADRYVEMLEQARVSGSLRTEEDHLLDQFECFTADILDRYWPAGPRNRESLAFAPLYEPQVAVSAEDRWRALVTALMAADVESRGPLRLTQQQNTRLAVVFERIGKECWTEGMLLHAARAFDRAAGIHLLLGNNSDRDRCSYARRQCMRRMMEPGWTKALDTVNWTLTGYGYQPYRLLLWVMVQLAVFGTVFTALTASITDKTENKPNGIWKSMYMFLTNFLNPLGVSDTDGLRFVAHVLLVAESYLGSVSLAVFFALLVRRWFQT